MKKQNVKIAVVGATGNVGRAMLSILEEHGFPAENITAVASEKSKGQQISYGEKHILVVKSLTHFDFSGYHLALFSPGGKVSAEYAPKAAAAGCVVIDNTSHFRMDADVPLVVPEINADALKDFTKRRIVANPNCSTIQLVMALKPLHDLSPIKRVVVSTYQSVSGAGKEAMDELFHQTRGVLVNDALENNCFTRPIAFNVIPQIDVFRDDGYTKEEWKMAVETQKIMDAPIQVTATCVRVPVFVGHAVAATIEFEGPVSVAKARQKLSQFPGVRVVDNPEDYQFTTPIECAGDDDVYISRIRQDKTVEHGLSLWIVADNIRKGAALNAVQIAERLIPLLDSLPGFSV
ncbi:aspartate-semialdehyde dehydrogenase [Candidatus Finniella inopinata]|uniref:Aspartate-semialdehyde dehydrogenase n=1 Tax=Candidatus Finniella inopinata TaxID=1696036 RepID=A0A4Q7DH51_9PROT|nr:aspartate-semialdehyde dehydrogenase [Candidatus Finniella inopinata]RZI46103.1 aspartate-semialdehyde dehydrogenase [Candidatus Finniella inopinata]